MNSAFVFEVSVLASELLKMLYVLKKLTRLILALVLILNKIRTEILQLF